MTKKNYVPAQRHCCIFGTVLVILCFLTFRIDIRTTTPRTNYSVPNNLKTSALSIIKSELIKSQYHQTERTCPAKLLHGREALNRTVYSLEDLNYVYKYMVDGHYKPFNCTAIQRVAIIVPYRDRVKQLKIFMNNVIPRMYRQQLEFGIYIVEQDSVSPFNRGMLSNIGFTLSQLDMSYDCYVIHDIDILPEDDRNYYLCSNNPVQMSTLVQQFGYKLLDYGGGIVGFSKEQYKRINGFSNQFFGWGGEDDDLYTRIKRSGYKLDRSFIEYGHCGSIKHNISDLGKDRKQMLVISKRKWRSDGLNNITYDLISITRNQLFVKVNVHIDMKRVRKVLS